MRASSFHGRLGIGLAMPISKLRLYRANPLHAKSKKYYQSDSIQCDAGSSQPKQPIILRRKKLDFLPMCKPRSGAGREPVPPISQAEQSEQRLPLL
jgi:hypothetical protein